MARLKQLYPANYRTGGNVNAEFENLVRYLVATERGNKTLSELVRLIFDDDGEFAPPIEFRVDAIGGLQYRIGEYALPEDGWVTITDIDSLRGAPGSDIGLVESPFFYNRQDVAGLIGEDTFTYAFPEEDMTIVAYQDGLLLAESEYTTEPEFNTVTLTTPLAAPATLTFASIRSASATGYLRADHIATENQAVFPAEFSSEDVLVVYKNGILQREGGSYDYATSLATQTITLMTPCTAGERVAIIRVQDNSLRRLLGVMTEDKWAEDGFIPYARLKINDGEVAQAKVAGLVAALAGKMPFYVSASEPADPANPSLWILPGSPPVMLFYDGSGWTRTTPLATLPDFSEEDAGKFVTINGTGTGFILSTIDFSSVIPKTQKGAANGVATLSSEALIPEGQIPPIYTIQSLSRFVDGAITNTTYNVSRIYRQTLKIDGVSARLSAGTCKIQLAVDGVGIGPVLDITTTALNENLGDIIQVDSSAEGKRLGIIVTNNSSGQNLEVGISAVSRNA